MQHSATAQDLYIELNHHMVWQHSCHRTVCVQLAANASSHPAALRVILTMAGAAVLSLVLPSHATLSYSTGSLH